MLRLLQWLFGVFTGSWSSGAQVVWAHNPGHRPLTEAQQKCVGNARWNLDKLRDVQHKGAEPTTKRLWLESGFWYIVFAHFKSYTDVYSSYSPVDLTLPSLISRVARKGVLEKVLLPKLQEIVDCDDPQEKATKVAQYALILMSGVFDPSGGTIRDDVLRSVLRAEEVSHGDKEFNREHRGSFLEPLGFKPHKWTEDGEEYVSWFWPNPA